VTGEQHSTPLALGTQAADASGNVTFTWTIRAGETLGAHAFTLTGPQSGTVSANFEVFAPAGGGGGGTLPRTGSSIAVLLSVAGLLLLAGTALVHRSRRA
jgi:LPXTG-motif cell wall-anchored protein